MPSDHEQVVVRRRKLEALRARGVDPYPNDFRPNITTAEVRSRFGAAGAETLAAAPAVRVAGRIMVIRDFGRAAFFHVQDRAGRLQVHVRRDRLGEEGFELFRLLDAGDIVGVEGQPFRTRTGELTVEAASLKLLAKALRPLPEKWHGLQDVEARYRQRYLDLLVNPSVRRIFELRTRIIQGLRQFLCARGFLEVETPMMQAIPGGAAARPFVTHHNALGVDLYLRIAPELYLKRLVVGGVERVFELNRTFRNEGISTEHNPEFTMLELYQAYATFEDLMTLSEELVCELAREVSGGEQLTAGEQTIDLRRPWRRVTLEELVARHTGLDSGALGDLRALAAVAERCGLSVPRPTAGRLLVALFERLAQPHLVQPTFVTHFPVDVSPLARRNDQRPDLVDRFELYIGGRELANAFTELADPEDQRERFVAQMREREAGDEEAERLDEDYLRALEHGLPPTAGEGIGVDRLVMLLTGASSIREVILFPQLRPGGRRAP